MPHYLIYARKSSESEDRQVLSIDSQIRELSAYARSQDLTVASVLSESRSAKAPGREVFGRMMNLAGRQNAQGILCWKLDRLARNPVDGGALIWAIEEGTLKEIVTPARTFTNNGNDKFWMQLEFGMAKKYVDDLSENVKRGNRAKLEQGWLPGVPPLGYLNDLGAKTIVRDPNRFPLIRKMWDLLLSGTSVPEILQRASDVWGLRTRKFKRKGGSSLAMSAPYKIFSNPFYYGLLRRSGDSYAGSHEPMVSKDEFERAQEILGRPSRPKTRRHHFAFTGLIRCGECGAGITAEEKVNRYGRHYTYYHCTKRLRGVPCSQKTIRLEALEKETLAFLNRVHVPDEFRDWALDYVENARQREASARASADRSLETASQENEKQLDRLLDLRIRGLLTDEEYSTKRQALVGEQVRLKEHVRSDQFRAPAFDPSEQVFVFANEAVRRFQVGSLGIKREILVAIGSNFRLKDKKLEIELKKPFEVIEEGLSDAIDLEKKFRRLEPSKIGLPSKRNNGLAAVISSWQATVDEVRTFFRNHPHVIQWPGFCKDTQGFTVVDEKVNSEEDPSEETLTLG